MIKRRLSWTAGIVHLPRLRLSGAFICIVIGISQWLPSTPASAETKSDDRLNIRAGEGYAATQKQPESEVSGVPAVFNTPETGLGIGAVVIYLPAPSCKKRSSVLGGVLVTGRRQFLT